MAALTTLMTRFCAGEDSWLARSNNISKNHGTSIPSTEIAGHVATNISAALKVIILRIQQSMPDSKALNLVSGKSHSKEALRARPNGKIRATRT